MQPVNVDDIDWNETDRGETEFRRKQLSGATDASDLGCSLYELPPGKKSWPFHWHAGNAEAVYVLAGTGRLRAADDDWPLRAGDYAVFPPGEGGAHRVVNDGDEPLRYLALSTMRDPDVTVYPDSGKFGVYAGSPPGGRDERSLEGYYRQDDGVDYWLDES